MNLIEHYNKLYKGSIGKIESGTYEVDGLIDSPTDNRFGITLLLRPDNDVKKGIREFLDRMKLIEPQQYYYRNSDIHVTVMSIISCYNGFRLSQIEVGSYIDVIKKSIKGLSSFDLEFKGLTASASCLMVQGFFKDNTLGKIRCNLRENFKNSGLEQSIDKRYVIQTAHSTILRLRKQLEDKGKFLKTVEEYRDYYFGSFTVDTLELVYNDWYQRKEYVKTLYRFNL